jgi:hypothetical protein
MAARVIAFLTPDEAPRGVGTLQSLGFAPGDRTQFSTPPEPRIVLPFDDVPTELSVTSFKTLLTDPYRFVLEKVYGLRTIDDTARELDPMGFGNLAHDVLHAFGDLALDSPPGVDIASEAKISETLTRLLDELVAQRFGPNAMPAVALQVEQLRLRLWAFAKRQAAWARQGWKIAAVECQPKGDGVPMEVDGTDLYLRGRIDRIDHNPSTGEWAVLDYKTGNAVPDPEKAHRKKKAGVVHWIDLQLPLYRLIAPHIVDRNDAPLVTQSDVDRDKVRLGYISLPKKAEECQFMLAEWDADDFAEAVEVAETLIRNMREGPFEYDPDVTRISRYGGDPLEPLLTVGWQATGDDDDQVPGGDPTDDWASQGGRGES